jgi:hypothetical protein
MFRCLFSITLQIIAAVAPDNGFPVHAPSFRSSGSIRKLGAVDNSGEECNHGKSRDVSFFLFCPQVFHLNL